VNPVPSRVQLIERELGRLLLPPQVAGRDFQAAAVARAQIVSAIVALKSFQESRTFHEDSLRALEAIQVDAHRIAGGFEVLADGMWAVHGVMEETRDLVEFYGGTITQELREQSGLLRDLNSLTRDPYQARASSLRERAEKLLARAQARLAEALREEDAASGEDLRKESDDMFAEALSVFQQSVGQPGAGTDAPSWFHIGVLRWQQKDFGSAKEAFRKARTYSRDTLPVLFEKSSRYLADLYHLSCEHDESLKAIRQVLAHSEDASTLLTAATYAAASGRDAEALNYLEECIETAPAAILTMFGTVNVSPEFTAKMLDLVARLTQRKREEALVLIQDIVIVSGDRDYFSGRHLPPKPVPDAEAAFERLPSMTYLGLLDFNSLWERRAEILRYRARADALLQTLNRLEPGLALPSDLSQKLMLIDESVRAIFSLGSDELHACLEQVRSCPRLIWKRLHRHLEDAEKVSADRLESHRKLGVTGTRQLPKEWVLGSDVWILSLVLVVLCCTPCLLVPTRLYYGYERLPGDLALFGPISIYLASIPFALWRIRARNRKVFGSQAYADDLAANSLAEYHYEEELDRLSHSLASRSEKLSRWIALKDFAMAV